MTEQSVPLWLKWAREIQSLAQSGLVYFQSEYEKERYERLQEISAEILANCTMLEKSTVEESFKIQSGYATPKIDVRAAIVRDHKILLVQERSDQKWCMPGGWADVGDLPSQAIIREVQEESGFTVETKKLIAVFDANRNGRPIEFYHAFKLIFWCEIIGGKARPSYETSAVDFFEFDQLPPLSSSRTNTRHLNEIQQHLKNPKRPTYFD
ncbi:MAG: NUDIX hydrolase [bacterium]|nr:NUDIX hydrolase [bacterium]